MMICAFLVNVKVNGEASDAILIDDRTMSK